MSDAALDQLVALSEKEADQNESSALELALADALACMASAVYQGFASSQPASVEDLVIAHSVLDLDDVDWATVHHPGSVVIPAVLAAAQIKGCSGDQLVTALSIGYRVSSGVAAMLDPDTRTRWHATAICGAFGAGAAAAALRGADRDVLYRTLALVASSVGGLAAAPRARNGAAVFTRVAAASLGVLAARGAQQGLPIVPGIVSGPGGLAEILSHAPARSIADVRGVESASLRLFPVTGFAHAAVWTASTMPDQYDGVKRLEVSVSEAAALMNSDEAWWNVAQAVGRSLETRDPFACDRLTDLSYEVNVHGAKLPIDRATILLETMDGSRVEVSGEVPGRLDDESTRELFSRKAHDVLAVSGQEALSSAAALLRDGAAAGEGTRNWMPKSIGH